MQDEDTTRRLPIVLQILSVVNQYTEKNKTVSENGYL
jgi:hypothetical protein